MSSEPFGLADLELYHSRPIAPTRRLALGLQYLPSNPSPGPGGLLLAGIVGHFASSLSEDDRAEMGLLLAQVEVGLAIVQPRLRHRLQIDRVGLLKSHHRLEPGARVPCFVLAVEGGSPLVNVLGAVYAAGNLPVPNRPAVFAALRQALQWTGLLDEGFIAHVSSPGDASVPWRSLGNDPLAWALAVLGLERDEAPTNGEIRRAYRDALRQAHPDHGGVQDAAAERIAELGEARRILLR